MEKAAGVRRTELGNFARFCLRDPRRTTSAAAFYVDKAVHRLLRRVVPPHYRYPAGMSHHFHPAREQPPAARVTPVVSPMEEIASSACAEEWNILLARGAARVAEIEPGWRIDSSDWEQIQSLHRWNWLLTRLTACANAGVRQWGLEKIESWLRVHGRARRYDIWSSYTVTERLTNALIFCMRAPALAGDPLIPSWIAPELETHAIWIVNNLEFYGAGVVGNHILNNARGAYFYGRTFGVRRFEEIAAELLACQLPVLTSRSGFLREGSSHYHFLITRWLLEILWLAEVSKDAKISALLHPYVAAAVEKCWFFLVYAPGTKHWSLPLIGDVSPDYPPGWLMDVGWSEPARNCFEPEMLPSPPNQAGWAALFNRSPGREGDVAGRREGMTAFPDDGWYRLEHGRFTIVWHVEPQGAPLHPSHGHCDTGSFCLYIDGQPVLADPGRYSYTAEDCWSVSAAAHNTLRLDGLDPFVYSHLYPGSYRAAGVKVLWEADPGQPEFVIYHDGFSRIGREITHRRIWRIREDALEILDRIEGPGDHEVEAFFQWAPDLEIVPADTMVSCQRAGTDAPLCRLEWSGRKIAGMKVVKGWFYPSYGQKAPATTVVYYHRGRMPMENRYLVTLGM